MKLEIDRALWVTETAIGDEYLGQNITQKKKVADISYSGTFSNFLQIHLKICHNAFIIPWRLDVVDSRNSGETCKYITTREQYRSVIKTK